MAGLSHPKEAKDRVKVLWRSGLTCYAITRKIKDELGDKAPSYHAIWRWVKEWETEAEGNAQTVEMEAIAS